MCDKTRHDRQRFPPSATPVGKAERPHVRLRGQTGQGGHGRIYLGERFTTIPALTLSV
jgi:hypothetical protein